MVPPPLRLPPACADRSRRRDDAARGGTSVAKAAKAHVHRRGFAVALSLASGEELLEDVREQLVGGHVLAPRHELTGGDLVENGRGLVVPGALTHDVALERVDRRLQATAVARGPGRPGVRPSARPSP